MYVCRYYSSAYITVVGNKISVYLIVGENDKTKKETA